MNNTPKPFLGRVVSTTVIVVLVAIGLSWAWHLLEPLVPVFITVAVVVVMYKVVQSRRDW